MKLNEEDKARGKNVKSLFSNPATRPFVFITGGLLLGAIGLSYMSLSKTADSPVDSGASVGAAPSITHVPGASNDPAHNALQAEQNRRALEAAQQAGTTVVPTVRGNTTDINTPLVIPTTGAPPVQPTPTQPTVTVPVTPPNPNPVLPPAPSSASNAPSPSSVPSAKNDMMDKQIVGYLSMWGPAGNRSGQEFMYAGKAPPEPEADPNAGASNGGSGSSSNVGAAEESKIRFIRAGSMLSARLITPLNSDTPGPVLAEIISGPLSGARLIGSMTLNKEALLVTFTQISKPGWPDIYTINAVGMDNRFSTALATDVNHHYFQRYFGMLGGAFLQAYGKAMSQQGSTTIIDPSGGVITQQDELSSEQIRRSAQGGVLSSVGDEWESKSDRDPTVVVAGKAGAPLAIRVLFLGNF